MPKTLDEKRYEARLKAFAARAREPYDMFTHGYVASEGEKRSILYLGEAAAQ